MKLKRLGALALAVCLGAASVAGCGSSNNSSASSTQQTKAQTDAKENENTESETTGTGAAESSVIDFDEEPANLVVEVVDLGMEMKDLQEVTDAVNAILLEKINCTVTLQCIHIADHATKVALAVAGGEQLDIVMTGRTVSLPSMVSDGILMPLDDLLAERGPVFFEKAENLLDGLKVDGKVYAVPGQLYASAARGCSYNEDLAEQLGIDFSNVKSFDDLTDIGQQLVDGGSGVYLMTSGDGTISMFSNFYSVELMGGDGIYGGIFDPVNSTEIVNVFTSDEFKHYCEVKKEWADKGFMPADSMVNGENAQDVYANQLTLGGQANDVSPLGMADSNKSKAFKTNQIAFTDNILSTSMIQEVGWGITTTCARPDKAMDFLNLMFTDGELANLLTWGIEGKHYVKVSDMIIDYPEGVDSNSVGYRSIFNRWGDAAQIYSMVPATDDMYDELIPYVEAAKKSATLGYVFNADSVSSEIAAVSNVISEYRPSLECGKVDDVEEALAEFNAALDSAGINTIIEENRAQLESWLAQQ